LLPHFSVICQGLQNDSIVSNQINHAATSPWLRRSWSLNYSVLVVNAVHLPFMPLVLFF
jgi:hypothetical protein